MKFGRILTITLASMLLSTPFAYAQDEDLGTRRPPKKQGVDSESPPDTTPSISWSYAEAGYAFVYTEDSDWNGLSAGDDLHGLGLEFSLEVFEYFHVAADYTWGEEDGAAGNKLERVFAGGGVHYSILENTDLFADLGYAYIEPGDASENDDGVSLRAGVRSLVLPKLELSLRGSYADRGNPADAGGSGRFGMRYYLTNMLALSTNLDYDSDSQLTFFLGFRVDFGREA